VRLALRTVWQDPSAWGLMLVDLARHAAESLRGRWTRRDEVLFRIRAGFDAEWSTPTDCWLPIAGAVPGATEVSSRVGTPLDSQIRTVGGVPRGIRASHHLPWCEGLWSGPRSGGGNGAPRP